MPNREGRPLKFETVEELEIKIESYFNSEDCDYTITGLALFLETDRATLMNYERRDEFFNTLKKAKLKIENAYEKRLVSRGNGGDIFALKNFGWVDTQTVNQNVVERIKYVSKEEELEVDKHIDDNT